MKLLLGVFALVAVAVVRAEVYFEEKFADGKWGRFPAFLYSLSV